MRVRADPAKKLKNCPHVKTNNRGRIRRMHSLINRRTQSRASNNKLVWRLLCRFCTAPKVDFFEHGLVCFCFHLFSFFLFFVLFILELVFYTLTPHDSRRCAKFFRELDLRVDLRQNIANYLHVKQGVALCTDKWNFPETRPARGIIIL